MTGKLSIPSGSLKLCLRAGPPSIMCLVLELAPQSLWDLLHSGVGDSDDTGVSPVLTARHGSLGDGHGDDNPGAAGTSDDGYCGGANKSANPSEVPISATTHGDSASMRTMLSIAGKLRMAREATAAIEFLHSQQPTPIAHCDVKSANFLGACEYNRPCAHHICR